MLVLDQTIHDRYALWQGDCVEVSKGIPDDSIHYSIFSPPFASLYTYSSSDRDMGNSRDGEEFQFHFGYLIDELYRITMPGRLVSVHCMNLPAMKSRDGFIGIKDFRGDIIRQFVKGGFIFHSEVCIWKNPVTEMQRTKALGLLHKQIRKDSSMCRQGIPDYIVTFRKPGENPEMIPHDHETFPVSVWQRYASPVWMDIRQSNTLQRKSARDEKDEKHICLAEGTLVLTKRGYIPIQEIKVGADEVLTNSGQWHTVVAKAKTQENAEVVKTIAQGVPNLITTPDHKLVAKKMVKWGDSKTKEPSMKQTPEWTEAKDCENHYLKSVLPPEMPSDISAQEWWIIGRWLADGHIDSRGHQFFVSIGREKWESFVVNAEGYIGHVAEKSDCNCNQVGLIDLSDAARSILKKCGKGAANKVLPVECISLNKELSKALLDGYISGDGHFMADGKITASSASRALLLGMAIVAEKVYGRVASVYAGRKEHDSEIRGRQIHGGQEWNLLISPNYSFSAIEDDGTWKKVKKVEEAGTADVWSIEVDTDHSYMAEGCVVKNCPLQLDVIERCIDLWTNPGDIVFDPFAGIGSVPYQAVLMGRRGVGIELKDSYFVQAKNNLDVAVSEFRENGADTNVRLRCPNCGRKIEGDTCPDCTSLFDTPAAG